MAISALCVALRKTMSFLKGALGLVLTCIQ
jgi:hypothetical protein